MSKLRAVARRWRRAVPLSSLVGLAAALLAGLFIELASEMAEGETHAFDVLILRAAQVLRDDHPELVGALRDLSGLGSATVLTLFTVITVGYLILVSSWRLAGIVASAAMMGAAAISLLKDTFARTRPAAAFAELVAPGFSFPSGHAGNSAIVFLTLGALLASTRHRPAEQRYILALAALLTLLVGLSRVALGVHWATDVLGGWAFGCAWALGWLLVSRAGYNVP